MCVYICIFIFDCDVISACRSREPELAKARSLLHDLRRRKLYKFADEYVIPRNLLSHFPEVHARDIAASQDHNHPSSSSVFLTEDDIIIHNLKIDYCKKGANPVDSVRFFDGWDDEVSHTIGREQVSLLLPEQFEERVIRVYVRNEDNLEVAQRAFRKYLRRYLGNIVSSKGETLENAFGYSTPQRKRRKTSIAPNS